MILKETSILRYLPVISEKDLLILDSIRFTAEMIDHSYCHLEKRILNLSMKSEERDYPALFLYSWTILDNTSRLIRLYKTFPSSTNHENIKSIEYVNSPRNTYQHLDERIDESLIDTRQPFYGTLKWTYSNIETGKAENHIAMSGIHYTDNNIITIGEYDKSNIIQDLILETVDKKNKKEINLSKLKEDLKLVIQNLENVLENQLSKQNLELRDWKSRRDVLFKLKGV